jgi:hypothetical protein
MSRFFGGDFGGKSGRSRIGVRTKITRASVGNYNLAIKNFEKQLRNILGPSDRRIEGYVEEMERGQNLRTMNMAVLAHVIVYLDEVKQVNDRTFSEHALRKEIDRFLPSREEQIYKSLTETDLQRIRKRMLATFLRYANYIQLLREKNREEDKVAREKQGEKQRADQALKEEREREEAELIEEEKRRKRKK